MLEAPMGIVWMASKKKGIGKMGSFKPFEQERIASSTGIRDTNMPSP